MAGAGLPVRGTWRRPARPSPPRHERPRRRPRRSQPYPSSSGLAGCRWLTQANSSGRRGHRSPEPTTARHPGTSSDGADVGGGIDPVPAYCSISSSAEIDLRAISCRWRTSAGRPAESWDRRQRGRPAWPVTAVPAGQVLPHEPQHQVADVLAPLDVPVQRRKVLRSMINEYPPTRVNHSMNLQVRHPATFWSGTRWRSFG